jgi:CO/xanthine dehydrogenase Mo-binding subunit
MGLAVKRAAEDARDKLTALAGEVGLSAETTPVRDLFRKKYGMQAGNVVGVGSFIPSYQSPDHDTGLSPDVTPFWMVGGAGVEVDVDTETGRVTVTKLVNVADVGTPINPRIVETQLSGGAIMQLGFTMTEKMEFDSGQVTNASLADYRIPGMLDIPVAIVNEAVDAEQKGGPFGAKGVGETATFSVSPAIANAIDDAVGVRLTALPMTPERVFRALTSRPPA